MIFQKPKSWDDWYFIFAKCPKREPRKKSRLPPPPQRSLSEEQKETIIDLIRLSKKVIGVDARLLTKTNQQ